MKVYTLLQDCQREYCKRYVMYARRTVMTEFQANISIVRYDVHPNLRCINEAEMQNKSVFL